MGLWTRPLPNPTSSTPLSSSQPGNSPREVKGCVPALGSQVLGAEIHLIAVLMLLCVHWRRGVLSLGRP